MIFEPDLEERIAFKRGSEKASKLDKILRSRIKKIN